MPGIDAAEVKYGAEIWRNADGTTRLVRGLHGPVLLHRHQVLASLEVDEARRLGRDLADYPAGPVAPRPTLGPRETKRR